MRDVKLGTFSPSVLVEVATATGALPAAGLTVTEVPAASSPAQFADLLDGRLDAVLTNPDNVVAYRCLPDNPLNRTADVRILAAIDGGLGLSLFRGHAESGPLAVDVPNSGFAFVAYELLDRLGVRGYPVEAMGSTPRRTEALLAGRCAFTVLNAGNDLRAEASGAHRLNSVTTLGPYVGTALAAVRFDDELLGKLVGALLRTSAELVAGEHRQVASEAARRRLRLDVEASARYVAGLSDPAEGLIPGGVLPPEALGTAIELRNRHTTGGRPLTLPDVLASGIVDDRFTNPFRRSAADAPRHP